MKIKVIAPNGLSPSEVDAWSYWQREAPEFHSPYFRPEFVRLAASVRSGVDVGVLEEDGTPVDFFPFQRCAPRIALPVAAPMNDFQAVITRPGLEWDPQSLLRECGLHAWHFDHLLASQQPFLGNHWKVAPSPFMDLSQGFDAYEEERRSAGHRKFSQMRQQARKLEKKTGPLRFVAHSVEGSVFSTLVQWKASQYVRTSAINLFDTSWIMTFLNRLRCEQGQGLSGMLSALYVGERLAAVHLGMRSHEVLHYWLPAYDPELHKHSPGMLLLMELARAAPALGIRRIDLGKGPEEFKSKLASGATAVAEGFVDTRPVKRALRHVWLGTRDWVHHSPFRRPAAAVAAFVRPFRTRRAMGL